MDPKKTIKILSIVAIVAVALLSLLLALRNSSMSGSPSDKDGNIIYKNLNPLEKNVIKILKQYEVPRDPSDLKIELDLVLGYRKVEAILPKGRPIEEVLYSLSSAAAGTKYTLTDTYLNEKRERAELTFKSKKKNREDIVISLRRGRDYASHVGDLAIIVSDLHTISPADRISFLTFDKGKLNYCIDAYNPDFDSSYAVLSRYEASLIVGLPMESKINRENKKTKYTIYLDDSPEMVEKKIENLLRHTPKIEAIATVGGSRVLSASSTTEPLMKELKKLNLIFFDRRKELKNNVTAKEIAEHNRVTYIIDNEPQNATTTEEIKRALKKAAYKASTYGRATIWFTASKDLISTIEELTPYFEGKGVKLSSVNNCYK